MVTAAMQNAIFPGQRIRLVIEAMDGERVHTTVIDDVQGDEVRVQTPIEKRVGTWFGLDEFIGPYLFAGLLFGLGAVVYRDAELQPVAVLHPGRGVAEVPGIRRRVVR